MMTMGPLEGQTRAPQLLLLLLILSLPLMKPAPADPIVATDLIFAVVLFAFASQLLSREGIAWRSEYWVLVVYAASFVPSLLATSDLAASLYKLATQFYLIGLALATSMLIDDETHLQRALLAWLAATVIVTAVGLVSLVSYTFWPENALLDYTRFHFGTLPPGDYPRLSLTFLNANMACNYLSVSAGILLVARACAWLSPRQSLLLLASIVICALATLSAGIGGLIVVIGLWLWLRGRDEQPAIARLALFGAIAGGIAFLVALAVTPIVHSTAPFLIQVPGSELTLAPSARFMLWTGALAEFARNPLIGHGIGIDATFVRYLDPSGILQVQTDAHNSFLNVGAQCGLFGLAGLATLLAYALRLARPWRMLTRPDFIRVGIAISFFSGFVYQGLGGSFEDARHLWVTLGLLMAAARISRADERNHIAGAPSPG